MKLSLPKQMPVNGARWFFSRMWLSCANVPHVGFPSRALPWPAARSTVVLLRRAVRSNLRSSDKPHSPNPLPTTPSVLLPAHLQRMGRPWTQINLLQTRHSGRKEILAFFSAEAVEREQCSAELYTGLSHALQDNDTACQHLFGSCFYYFDGFNTTLFNGCDLQGITQVLGVWILSASRTQVAHAKLAPSGETASGVFYYLFPYILIYHMLSQ